MTTQGKTGYCPGCRSSMFERTSPDTCSFCDAERAKGERFDNNPAPYGAAGWSQLGRVTPAPSKNDVQKQKERLKKSLEPKPATAFGRNYSKVGAK